MYILCLAYSYNEMPYISGLNRNLFLTVLEVRKFDSWWEFPSWLQVAGFLACPHVIERERALNSSSSYRVQSPHGMPPSQSQLKILITSQRSVSTHTGGWGFSTYIQERHQHLGRLHLIICDMESLFLKNHS